MDTGDRTATAIVQHRHRTWAVATAAGVLAAVLLIRQRGAGTTRWYRFAPADWQLVSADHVPVETINIRAGQAANRFDLWRYQLQHAST
jgi:hypothetical protein